MAFPPQFLDEVRARVSLADVVARHVKLTKRGREYIGLCPFHKERTPSFNVVEDKGFYHCFGCGAHGDVIGFSMRNLNLSFREAVEALANQAGLKVPADSPKERERAAQAASLYDVCEAACVFFEERLKAPVGSHAAGYLGRRGLGPELIARFRLGYSPAGGGALLQDLGKRFPKQALTDAGLIRTDESGRAFDFFRDRVIFPICDRQGRVIAFGGRTLGEGQPKYLNSPESPIFQKGRTLYAMHLARKATSEIDPPIVAEGYVDVIALHGAGFQTAVAPLGTALTELHLGELWKLSTEPVLCFDGDAAGERAAGRTLERALPLLGQGHSFRIVSLPAGEDPDSLIQSGRIVQFRESLKSSLPISEYMWNAAIRGKDLSTPERLAQLHHTLTQKILLIEDRKTQQLFRRYVEDKIWELRSRRVARSRPKGDQYELPSQIDDRLDDERVREKIQIVILSLALIHPHIARNDIDHFATISPKRLALSKLHHKILEVLAADPDIGAERLESHLVDEGYGSDLARIFKSDVYLARALVRAIDADAAADQWTAAFSRYLLPDVRQQLDEAVKRWIADATDANLATMMMYRQLIEEQLTEASLIRERWDAAGRTADWRPRSGMAA
jgi:DNA primase